MKIPTVFITILLWRNAIAQRYQARFYICESSRCCDGALLKDRIVLVEGKRISRIIPYQNSILLNIEEQKKFLIENGH
jgi:hypothetical protein